MDQLSEVMISLNNFSIPCEYYADRVLVRCPSVLFTIPSVPHAPYKLQLEYHTMESKEMFFPFIEDLIIYIISQRDLWISLV